MHIFAHASSDQRQLFKFIYRSTELSDSNLCPSTVLHAAVQAEFKPAGLRGHNHVLSHDVPATSHSVFLNAWRTGGSGVGSGPNARNAHALQPCGPHRSVIPLPGEELEHVPGKVGT